MATKVCVVYHSGFGHTAKQAAAVAEGARGVSGVDVSELPVEEFAEEKSAAWELLDAAEAIIFGCPTYMGSPSAGMKKASPSRVPCVDSRRSVRRPASWRISVVTNTSRSPVSGASAS